MDRRNDRGRADARYDREEHYDRGEWDRGRHVRDDERSYDRAPNPAWDRYYDGPSGRRDSDHGYTDRGYDERGYPRPYYRGEFNYDWDRHYGPDFDRRYGGGRDQWEDNRGYGRRDDYGRREDYGSRDDYGRGYDRRDRGDRGDYRDRDERFRRGDRDRY